MPYSGCVADVLGVDDELGVVGFVVAKVVDWYLEFCEKFSQTFSYFFSYHVPSEFVMLGKHSGDILVGDRGRWIRYLCCVYLFCGIDRRKNGRLDLHDGAAMILRIACKKLLHLPLLLSLHVFLKRLADFFQHVVEQCHDDVLIADLRSSHGVECLSLDLTRDFP
jgi:hypothetical protein